MPDPRQNRGPRPPRAIRPVLRDAAPLVMLASALFYTNQWLSLTGDETSTLSAAANNLTTILSAARSAVGNARPPIYELLLKIWLWITGGAFDWLRAPAILCFVLGLWLLSRVARQLGGEESSNALVWLGALWPFGFHAGRLAAPYTFAFFLIAAVTWQYFRYLRLRRRSDWVVLWILCFIMLYTNDFAWALLALLALDYYWRIAKSGSPQGELPERKPTFEILLTAAVLALGFAPRWPIFIRELHFYLGWPHSLRFLVLNAAYNFYTLFVSQSVAPWFWRFSIPAGLGVVLLLAFVFAGLRGEARRLLIFSLVLFSFMALAGILQEKRLLLLGPWLLLPIAIALGTIEKWQWRIPIALAMAVVATIGWYGALNKRYYAETRFSEPWTSVAQDAADALRSGSGVISNDNAFFFYLTYALKPGQSNSRWRFAGALPRQVQYTSVWDPKQWEEAGGRPKLASVLWIRGSSPPNELTAMDTAGEWLSGQCGDRITRYLARDPGYVWKQRFVPNFSGPPWRIEIRQYLCSESAAPPAAPAPSHQ